MPRRVFYKSGPECFDVHLGVKVTPALKLQLIDAADRSGVSQSDFIRLMLVAGLSAHTAKNIRATENSGEPARRSADRGFMLAPLLYMLALGGIGAAVMFSGYSQVLRSNAEMTAINSARQQLNSAGQTLSASAVLDSATSTIVQPPAVTTYAAVTDTSRLPTNYAGVNSTGTPHDYGVIDVNTGVRQLDPWGKYYVYCRWENPVASASAPSIMVISAGPDGSLSTKCGDTSAQGDDRVNKMTVAEAINRANVWLGCSK